MGYPTCTEEGLCDRVCGEPCKDGSRYANCLIDPCDARESLCPEAVSCRSHNCGGACEAVYFAADGTVLADCEGAAELDLVVVRGAHASAPPAATTSGGVSGATAFNKNSVISLVSA